MELLKPYPSPADNFFILGAALSFLLFMLAARISRLASSKDPYSRLNRIHALIYIPYLLSALLFAWKSGEISPYLLPGLLAGTFIYFGLHYVYFFALVGLVKKSISVKLLSDLASLASGGSPVPPQAFLTHEKAALDLIRADRLGQMTLLGLANRAADTYTITPKGRFVNFAGGLALRLWNLRRL